MKKRSVILTLFSVLFILAVLCTGTVSARAEEASAVSVGEIDYENYTMILNYHGNATIYMSTDNRKTWNEVDGEINGTGDSRTVKMDISWVSAASDVKLYFKGNSDKTEVDVTLPKTDTSFKVKFDKINTDFVMTNETSATSFMWRKNTDYTWTEVPFDTASSEYKSFLAAVENLRFKGAKLVFRTGQVKGTNAENVGSRPSKEVTVSITKYGTAPSIKLNVVKLTLNTKESYEYTTDLASGTWNSCEKGMSLADIAPGTLLKDGNASAVTVYFRVAQTEKKAASLISSITIPAQTAAPDAGAAGTDVECSENTTKKKYELSFKTASSDNMFEYCVVTPDKTFDLSKAKWKTVKASKTILITQKSAPDGSVVYFRFKGTAENLKKKIALKLPSAYTTFTINWTPEDAE